MPISSAWAGPSSKMPTGRTEFPVSCSFPLGEHARQAHAAGFKTPIVNHVVLCRLDLYESRQMKFAEEMPTTRPVLCNPYTAAHGQKTYHFAREQGGSPLQGHKKGTLKSVPFSLGVTEEFLLFPLKGTPFVRRALLFSAAPMGSLSQFYRRTGPARRSLSLLG